MIRIILLAFFSIFVITSCGKNEISDINNHSGSSNSQTGTISTFIPDSETMQEDKESFLFEKKNDNENKETSIKDSGNRFYHLEDCDTQGIFIKDGIIYESCKVKGKTKIVSYKKSKGKEILKELNEEDFEVSGITFFNGSLVGVTHQGVIINFSKDNLEIDSTDYLTDEISDPKGIASSDNEVFVSNGKNKITILDKELQFKGNINLGNIDGEIDDIEFSNGFLFANDKKNKFIYKISNKGDSINKIDTGIEGKKGIFIEGNNIYLVTDKEIIEMNKSDE